MGGYGHDLVWFTCTRRALVARMRLYGDVMGCTGISFGNICSWIG